MDAVFACIFLLWKDAVLTNFLEHTQIFRQNDKNLRALLGRSLATPSWVPNCQHLRVQLPGNLKGALSSCQLSVLGQNKIKKRFMYFVVWSPQYEVPRRFNMNLGSKASTAWIASKLFDQKADWSVRLQWRVCQSTTDASRSTVSKAWWAVVSSSACSIRCLIKYSGHLRNESALLKATLFWVIRILSSRKSSESY